jgi:hypothetical protein
LDLALARRDREVSLRRELRELEAQVDDRANVTRDPALHNRIERLRGILKEYER